MAFNAKEKIEPLDYDFDPYTDRKGTIPEPSTDTVTEFIERLATIYAEAGLDMDKVRSGQVPAAEIAALTESSKKALDDMVGAVADLTGIAHSDLNALPFRIRQAFVGWIVGEFSPQQ